MDVLNIEPTTTALVLIDLQKGIVGRQLQPRSGQAVVTTAVKLLTAFRAAGSLVTLVHVKPRDGNDWLKPICDAPVQMPNLPADWAELVPQLNVQPSDLIITKRQWGAFYGTELDLQCRRRGIKTIVLGGISTNIGVESTARDAYERGYQQIFVEDACATMDTTAHEFAFKNIFPRIGRIRTSDQVIAGMGK